ncbi:MAG: FAD:protein FMN transferase [Chloroflexi bacterium]|nr:FAD:protein FMN transferase [Chloroflexota bacterium]
MNTLVLLAAEGNPSAVSRGFEQTTEYVRTLEARLTRFSSDSELAQLNASAGVWFEASEELYEIVHQASEFRQETGGLFDPAVLAALELAGYDRSIDEVRAHGAATSAVVGTYRRPNFDAVEFDSGRRAVKLPPGVRIDLGGIAKGWIAEHAALRLARCSRACAVNAGGDMFSIGLPAGEETWRVAIESPLDAERTLAILRLDPGAVATSSIAKRRWEQGDAVRHHLIDPRVGLPAETDWLSVTVIAPHATVAEVYAKALLITGSRSGEVFAKRRTDIEFIGVDKHGNMWGSSRAMEFLDVGP